MSIGSRAAMFKVTRMGCPNLGVGMAKFEPNWPQLELPNRILTKAKILETQTPMRQMNAHITYHVAQANQAKHGSLVDRGANGGLAGSDIRVLSTFSRKSTVTGIDNDEILGLDLLQCAALVQTNHGMVNLIMNEYAYYGRGHSIHSSGQIELYTNIVHDKSVQVGGQQRIVTIDGYSMPLICKGGLMYLEL